MNAISELVALVSLDFNKNDFKSVDGALKGLQGSLGTFVKGLLAVEGIKAFAGFIGDTITAADQLNDVAMRIGTTTQVIQELGYAAQLSGSSQEDMIQSLKFLTKAMSSASEGGTEAVDAFKALGVSIYGANGQLKNADQLLVDSADGFAKMKNPTEKAALALKLFGRSGNELVPFLSQGSKEIEKLRKRANDLGGVFDDFFIQQSAEFKDNMDDVSFAMRGVGATIGKVFLPYMNKLIKAFTEWYEVTGKIITQGFANFLGGLLKGFTFLIKSIVAAFNMLPGEVQTVLKALTVAFAAIIALEAIIASPILLAVAAFGAFLLVLEDIQVWLEGGDSLIGRFLDHLSEKIENGTDGISELLRNIRDIFRAFNQGGMESAMAKFYDVLDRYLDMASKRIREFLNDAGLKGVIKAIDAIGKFTEPGTLSEPTLVNQTAKNKPLFSGITDFLSGTGLPGDNFLSNGIKGFGETINNIRRANQPVQPANMLGSAAASNNTAVTSRPTFNNTITINANNMSQEELTVAVQQAITEGLEIEIQNAYNALVPGVR